ncbi:hypothetical protein [Adhaeribacter soli]|uniref:DUF481 domain-containing protein n=1 Tax=Adhaeribacter soli TaxID=2607655 RepID=A0A5N1ITA8_9BACT|nr:hypothetical protein [Adhaeribacter soli]KAA9331129.1 hypothetical protein F0P94_14620 [Adhaeribacter soli]
MKNKLFALVTFLMCGFTAFSQTSDSIYYKNQLGIIGGHGGSIGIIYKRQVKPDGALRLIESGTYYNRTVPEAPISVDASSYKYKESSLFLQTLIGYEWQRKVSHRWVLRYGADGGFGFGKRSSEYEFKNYKPDESAYAEFQNFKSTYQAYIIKPFAGVQFEINRRFCIGLESSLSLQYEKDENKRSLLTWPSSETKPVTTDLVTVSSNSFNMNFSPVSNIQLVYKF